MSVHTKVFWYSFSPTKDVSMCRGTIYPTPPLGQDMTQGQFLSGV